MFDGTKICDLSVVADVLLRNPALDFKGRYSQSTGEIETDHLTAHHRGLTFRLRQHKNRTGYRVEVNGSLHKYANGGHHNADDFTASRLLAALKEFVTTFGVDPFMTRINNIEFGVNVGLTFPVCQVLDNLIHYKNRPFSLEIGDGFRYHQCRTQRYVVKIYDKGNQYRATVPDLPDHLLRVEVKVLKMEYLTRRRINLNTLADLLRVDLYPMLGALLVETFTDILFDEPDVDDLLLRPRDRDLLLRGRNVRHWIIPDGLTSDERPRKWKQLQRDEINFRDLLNRHRPGRDWQTDVAGLIGQTWNHLTTVTPDLQTAIADELAAWKNCPLLTGLPTIPETGILSTINHLDKGSFQDSTAPEPGSTSGGRGTVKTTSITCPITGATIPNPRPRQRFVPAAILRTDDALLMRLQGQFRQYRKGSQEDEFSRAAHNVRNRHSNDRNNTARRLNRVHAQPLLFDAAVVDSMVRLTADKRAELDFWNGTDRELRFG